MSLISFIIEGIKRKGISVSKTTTIDPPPAFRPIIPKDCKEPSFGAGCIEVVSAFKDNKWHLFFGTILDAYKMGNVAVKTETGRIWDFKLDNWRDLVVEVPKIIQSYKLLSDKEFLSKVRSLCDELGIPDYRMLLAVMIFESRLDPSAVNKYSGATGLIQFMPQIARLHGTTVADLVSMTALEQLEYVKSYLRVFAKRMHTCQDTYMAVFCPVAVGKPDTYELPYRDKAYLQNKGLDLNKDGVITKGEASKRVLDIYLSLCSANI